MNQPTDRPPDRVLSAREDLLDRLLSPLSDGPIGSSEALTLIDRHRAAVLREAVDAIDARRTRLHAEWAAARGPVGLLTGMQSARNIVACLGRTVAEPTAACCYLHKPVGCCDPEDCGPCCEDCPTCPTLASRRAEVLREAATTIRAKFGEVYDDAGQAVAEGLSRAADLIDPDTQQHQPPCRFPLSPDCTCTPSTEGGVS